MPSARRGELGQRRPHFLALHAAAPALLRSQALKTHLAMLWSPADGNGWRLAPGMGGNALGLSFHALCCRLGVLARANQGLGFVMQL